MTLTKALSTLCLLALTPALHADPIRVKAEQGTLHGFLDIRNETGEILGHGDLLQSTHGDRVTTELILHFNNGSVDDETATFTQNHTFHLLSDHHIQKGPFFPKPLDITVEDGGQITTRSTDKDGKPQVDTQHLDLPSDICNGMIGPLLMNVPANTPEFTQAIVLPAGKGRLAKLHIAPESEQSFTVAGVSRKATVFRIKIDLGGVAGVVAPVVGKQPADVHVWVVEGTAPEVVRVQQQLYEGGPIVSVELAGATFPHDSTR